MLVQAMMSFAAIVNGQMVAVRAGEVVTLPAGADWVTAGLAIPFEEDGAPVEIETAMVDDAPGVEHAVTRKRKGRK